MQILLPRIPAAKHLARHLTQILALTCLALTPIAATLLAATLRSTTLRSATLQSTTQPHWQLGPFTRPVTAPVLIPNPASTFTDPIAHTTVHWESLHTFNPAAILRNNAIYLLYRAEDDSGTMQIGMHTSRLGLATSTDGVTFTRQPDPVFYPAPDDQQSREWPGGVEDPRLVEADPQPNHPAGLPTYVLTYTQWNRTTYSIGIATSPDLIHWTKHGPAFLHSAHGRYDDLKYKSGGIVTQLTPAPNPHLVAAKINGTYWMYWGEGSIHLATSPDLIHWTPVEDAAGHLVDALTKRPGHFDSGFPEVGPPPVLTSRGIVVLYNGKNDPDHGDPTLGPNAYAAGQALFDPHHPDRLLARDPTPTLKPEQPYEKTGQYIAGTTFAEALVRFHNHWFLYYGCADSAVGVVSAP